MDCKSDVMVIERKIKYGVFFLQSLLFDAALALGRQKAAQTLVLCGDRRQGVTVCIRIRGIVNL